MDTTDQVFINPGGKVTMSHHEVSKPSRYNGEVIGKYIFLDITWHDF